MWPIVERELRVQARAPGSFWLRIFAGLAAVVTLFAAFQMDREMAVAGRSARGPWLFALLHTAICFFFAVSCPLMSSDTVARERREGTLGILLLTPLAPASIVTGKMLVHLLRAFTIWLAFVPVLTVPVLLGGIGVIDVVFALGLELGVVLGSLAAGLMASSLSIHSGKAMGLAMVLTLLVGQALAWLSFLGLLPSLLAHPTSEYCQHLLMTAIFGPWFLGTGLLGNGFSGFIGRNPAWMQPALLVSLTAVLLGACVAALSAVGVAARQVRGLNTLRELTPTQQARRQFWVKRRYSRWGKSRWRTQLNRNPMLWLYTGQPAAALTRWSWCGVVLAVWALVVTFGSDDVDMAALVFSPLIALVFGLAVAASTGFRRELEEGTLELLLVTPIPPENIVRARVVSLWRDFLPALGMASAMAVLWANNTGASLEDLRAVLVFAWSSLVALPAIGSRLAVRRLSPLAGWLWTLAIGLLLPYLFALLGYTGQGTLFERLGWTFVPCQLAAAGFCAWCTVTDLATRRFRLKPLQRATR